MRTKIIEVFDGKMARVDEHPGGELTIDKVEVWDPTFGLPVEIHNQALDERDNKIIQLNLDGMSFRKIAKQVGGISSTSVGKVLKKHRMKAEREG